MTTITLNGLQAFCIRLVDGTEAVLIQDGPKWNGLGSFRCVYPPQFSGCNLIAMPHVSGAAEQAFSALLDTEQRWDAVMVSPSLAVAIPGLVK